MFMSANLLIQFFRARWVQTERGVVEDGGVVVVRAPMSLPRIVAVIDPQSSPDPTTDEIIQVAEAAAVRLGHNSSRYERLPDRCLGDVALLPGMVNCHTHLEFSDCREPLGAKGLGFSDWLQKVIAHRARTGASADEGVVAAKAAIMELGWQEILASGVAAAGEILSRPAAELRCSDSPSPAEHDYFGTVFHEVLGLAPNRAQASWDWAVECLKRPASDRIRLGLSPHAPYSTSTWLYRQCADHCSRYGLPLATHLAESREELQLLSDRSGALVEVLERLGVWRPEQIEARSVRDVMKTVVDVERLLLIHGNYIEREDWRWLVARNPNATIVYCPQTHAHFQHERHPWAEMAADGLCVAFGTDSRASSPSLSLWNDLQLVRESYPEQDPAILWRMATINGANALGLGHELGGISSGKLARFCVADFGSTMTRFSWEALLSPTTIVQGLSGMEL